MQNYECELCGYVYNPAEGDSASNVPANTEFKDLPESWVCPLCGAPTSQFTPA